MLPNEVHKFWSQTKYWCHLFYLFVKPMQSSIPCWGYVGDIFIVFGDTLGLKPCWSIAKGRIWRYSMRLAVEEILKRMVVFGLLRISLHSLSCWCLDSQEDGGVLHGMQASPCLADIVGPFNWLLIDQPCSAMCRTTVLVPCGNTTWQVEHQKCDAIMKHCTSCGRATGRQPWGPATCCSQISTSRGPVLMDQRWRVYIWLW